MTIGQNRREPIFSVDWLTESGIRILMILALAILLALAVRFAVRRFERRLTAQTDATAAYNLQRAATVAHVLSSVARVTIWLLALLLILGEFGFSLGPLIAGAGVVGVALGFGAQSLVRDFLSGFFILLEDQLAVGDVADIHTSAGLISGKVEAITLRTTSVRSFDGTVHTIPNGNVQVVGNKSRGWARAIVDVRLAQGADVEHARRALDELFDELEGVTTGVFTRPTVLGVETLGSYEVVMRVVAETKPSKRWEVERELRERIKQRLDQQGVATPFAGPFPLGRPPEEQKR